MRANKIIFFILFNGFILSTLQAQDGTNDSSFNPIDIGYSMGDGPSFALTAIALQNDGKALISGSLKTYNGKPIGSVARLNADGTLDESFHASGSSPTSAYYCLSVLPNGKIIAADKQVKRINADGTIDSSFNSGTGVDRDFIKLLELQNDGKMLITGTFYTYNGIARRTIARLNADGSVDTTFNAGPDMEMDIRSIALQNDGKILIAGSYAFPGSSNRQHIVRLNADGTVDKTFDTGTSTYKAIQKAILQKDGKIIILGYFTEFNGVQKNYIARLNSDGTIDSTYQTGTGSGGVLFAGLLQNDGKLLIFGNIKNFNGTPITSLARLNEDGTLDTSFEDVAHAGILKMIQQKDGKIIIIGNFMFDDNVQANNIFRLNVDGTRDYSYNAVGTGASYAVLSSAIQKDGKIIIGGDFTFYNGKRVNRIARLNADGTLDGTFHTEKIVIDPVRKIVIQKDGKILIGTKNKNASTANCLYRLNADGTLDATFNIGTGTQDPNTSSAIWGIALQADEKIVIGGFFTQFNGLPAHHFLRLNTDGSIDKTFDVGSGVDYTVKDIAIQPADGKIIIVGGFAHYQAVEKFGIARIETTGKIDNTFLATGTDSELQSVLIQQDGKIIVGGMFYMLNSDSLFLPTSIARLNANGTTDNTYSQVQIGFIYSTANQPDGKILIGGAIPHGIARINADGTIDNTFDPGTGTEDLSYFDFQDNNVYTISLQNDKQVIIGGYFTAYNKIGRNRIARLLISPTVGVEEYKSPDMITIYPNPFNIQTKISLNNAVKNGTLKIIDMLGKDVRNTSFSGNSVSIQRDNLEAGVYFMQVIADQHLIGTQKVVIQ